MPKVSVIIPVYNVEKYLERCLESVINQTLRDIEIICVNDCSPDDCAQILEDYVRKDERIIIVNREENGGLSAARNFGIDVATGEYIYFLDSDDWIDLDYIEKMVEAVDFSKVDIVVNTNTLAEFEDKTEIFSWDKYQKAPENGEFLSKEQSINITPCMTWAHIFKKSFLDKYKLKFPEGYIHEDNYFQYISEVWTDKIFAFNGSSYHYRQNNNGIMNSRVSKIIPYIKIHNLIYDYYILNNLLYKYNIKICNPKAFCAVVSIDEYNSSKHFFTKLSEYFNKSDLYDEFDKYIINAILNTKDFIDYKIKYKKDMRVSFLQSKLITGRK